MEIVLKYGKTGLKIPFPGSCNIKQIEKKPMPVLANPVDALQQTLQQPISGEPLEKIASTAQNACILICDITRPVPNGVILPVLVRQLLKAGVAPGAITVLVATGLHRPNEGEELAELIGDPWVLDTVKVENHFARNNSDHVDLGKTTNGLPVKLDRRFVGADLKIVTGLVEPHFMAGFSGGRKVIVPGIAHQDTIRQFHTAKFLEHPRAANCVLDGNPLHDVQLEIVRKLSPVMAVNAVIDDRRRVTFLNYGEIEPSHLEAVDFLRAYVEIAVPQKFSTVLTSAGGYPLDKTYYQTVKGMVGAMNILKPGGELVIVSECSEGMGSVEYVAAQRSLIGMGPKNFLDSLLSKHQAAIDEWQTEMQLKPMRLGSIHLYSDQLPAEQRALTGVQQISELSETLQACIQRQEDQSIAVIPDGPYVVPVCAD